MTSRVLLGTMVTPLPRRRPQMVAREVVTLDHLSNGRAVLGVGLGDDFEFEAFGEPLNRHGARLDEALVVLQSLLSGEAVDFEGDHFVVHSPPSLPRPVQESIPIWVGGHWPNPAPFAQRRATTASSPARWAWNAARCSPSTTWSPSAPSCSAYDDFAYVMSGLTDSPTDTAAVSAWHAAGANWWLEALHPWGADPERMRDRVRRRTPASLEPTRNASTCGGVMWGSAAT